MKHIKRPVSILLSLLMIASLFTIVPFASNAKSAIAIYNHHWDSESNSVIADRSVITDYTELSERGTTSLFSLIYSVTSDTTETDRLVVGSGSTAGIYLGKGATLTCNGGICVEEGATLNIYAATSTSGKLVVNTNNGSTDKYCASIGSDNGKDAGSINIHGGSIDVTARHGAYGACIGGGYKGSPECVTIWDGNVNCHHDAEYICLAAAIGGGNKAPVSSKNSGEGVRIYGGTVVAKSRSGAGIGNGDHGNADNNTAAIAICGGNVTAYSRRGAGIGSGLYSSSGPINIYGGTVNAYSVGTPDDDSGAGIGGGQHGDQKGTINISGGTIFATGAEGAGIGGGDESNSSIINITGGNVVANSTTGGAGIGGGCEGNNGTVNISGANTKVTATSETYKNGQAWSDAMEKGIEKTNFYSDAHKYYAGIMLIIQGLVELFGGEDSGCGIGGGYEGRAGTITIDGSTVVADSGSYSAAIGSGDDGAGGGSITIKNGADVYADSGTDAAAIGSGNEVDHTCDVTITDSNVEAHGGAYAAGIGGGDDTDSGTITIKNSTVTADTDTDGSGIGSGESGDVNNITVDNSTVTAKGGAYGAGIGGGDDGDCKGTITIKNNSVVNACGGTDAAGIGGGEDGEGGNVVISNSTVTAKGKEYGAGIGGGENKGVSSVRISYDSKVEAVAGSDGNSVAIGHGDYNTFASWFSGKPSNGTLTLSPASHIVDAGSDKNSAKRYTGNSIWDACRTNKYAYVHQCEHNNTEWRPYDAGRHGKYCTDCGNFTGELENHIWNDNECTVCGATGHMAEATFIEKDNDGTVSKTVTYPENALYNLPVPENIPDGMEFVCWEGSDGYHNSPYLISGEDIVFSETTYKAVYLPVVDTTYIDENGDEQIVTAKRLTTDKLCLSEGWYVVDEDLTISNSICAYGEVNLILADDKTVSSSLNNDIFIDDSNKYDSFSVYGQYNQSGKMDCPSGRISSYDFSQYGGKLEINSVSALNDIALLGGNSVISGVYAKNQVTLGWSRMNDSIYIRNYLAVDPVNFKISDGQALKDENENVYQGTQSSEVLTRKTLTPNIIHNYSVPEWTWEDDCTRAKATFKCTDSGCDNELTVNAYVSYEDSGHYRYFTATCELNGVTYTSRNQKQIRWDINCVQPEHGTISVNPAVAAQDDSVSVTVNTDSGYVLKSIKVTPDDESIKVNVKGNTFKMPACDVTVSAELSTGVSRKEPYIDENGDYQLGNIAYYELDGKKYAINNDGSVGDELSDDDIVLSYFDFTPINNDTEYQIRYYTGPTGIDELVIPKSYNGKKITQLGSDAQETLIDYGDNEKTQFELKLNENITKIGNYSFYTLWVTKVSGDTSNLKTIGNYAFSWANSLSDYTLDINLDYKGTISVGASVFNHMNVNAAISHDTKFSSTAFGAQSMNYTFTDNHKYGEPIWTWADDNTSASAKFICTDSRCKHEETVNASLSIKNQDGKSYIVATVELNGETYTDSKESPYTYVPKVEPYIDSSGEYQLGTVEHFEYNGKKYAVTDNFGIGGELSDDELALSYFDFALVNGNEYQINYYTGPTDTLTKLEIPKTYQGKKITILGNDVSSGNIAKRCLFPDTEMDHSFELVLTENITKITTYCFYETQVSKVSGDTSNLSTLERYAFIRANSVDSNKLDIKLDYIGNVSLDAAAFGQTKLTVRLSHNTKLLRNGDEYTGGASSVSYIFTDAHKYGNPTWTWADDYSSATAKFTCTDSRCKHSETVDAAVTSNVTSGKNTYTATAEFEGNTYTDTKSYDLTTINYKYNIYDESTRQLVEKTITKTVDSSDYSVQHLIELNEPKILSQYREYGGYTYEVSGNTINVQITDTEKKYTVYLDGDKEGEYSYLETCALSFDEEKAFIIDGKVVCIGTSYSFYVGGDTDITTEVPTGATVSEYADINLNSYIIDGDRVTLDMLASANVEKGTFQRMGVAFALSEKTEDEIASAVQSVETGSGTNNKIYVHNSKVDQPNQSGQYQFRYAPYFSIDKAKERTIYFYTYVVTDEGVKISSAAACDMSNLLA